MKNPSRVLLVVLVLATLILPGCQPKEKEAADLLEKVTNRGTLIIATDPAYPPASQLVEGVTRPKDTKCAADQRVAAEFVGFDIDTAVEVARRLGVEACFVTPDWTLITGGNWSDRWDISIGSMTITAERMDKLYFTFPYYVGIEAFYVHKDSPVQSIEELSGKKIGACSGCTYEYYLDKTLAVPGLDIDFLVDNPQFVGYDTDVPALQDLALGDGVRLDAVMTGMNIGDESIVSGLPLRRLEPTITYSFNGGAVDKAFGVNPVPLVKKVGEIILAMHQDGTLKRYSMDRFGYDCVTDAAIFDLDALEQW